MTWVDEVIGFWFDTLRPVDWWSASPAIDGLCRERFGPLLDTLSADPPVPSTLDARGHLAAVLVFDQFPRHLFRGSARACATDALAVALTVDAIDRGLDTSLRQPERQFLYMPLMHAEDGALQQRSLAMFGRLDDPRSLRSARAHHDTYTRFGRFPYRNDALDRPSTAEECAFLAKKPGPA